MDEVGDVDIKHDPSNPYGQPPSNHIHRMPPAETPTSYSYPPPSGAGMPPPGPAWNPTPSPYNDPAEHRPPPPDMAHHSPYPPPPPPPQSYPPHHPPPGRETPGYPPDPGYGRPGSVSGPARSPAEVQQPPYHPVSTNPHEPSYYPPPADYRPRHDYPGPPPQPNGTHQQSPLHVVTGGHDMMPGQPPGQPSYGPPSAGPPPSAGAYPYSGYPPYAEQRRKPVRAAQACDSCRQRKAKCDEGRPECQHCKDNGLKCSYREIPPQKSEKQVLQITAQLESLSEDVKALAQKSDQQEGWQGKMEQLFRQQDDKFSMLLEQFTQFAQNRPTPSAPPEMPMHMTEPPPPFQNAVRPSERPSPAQLPRAPLFRRHDSTELRSSSQSQHPSGASIIHIKEDKEEEPDPAMDTPMPAKHTTAAQNLLGWPSIKALIPRGITPAYVMDEETGRGLLRLYGCGEGEDKGDGHEGAPSPANSNSSEGRRMDDETTTSSSSPHGVWGNGQLHMPLTNYNQSARDHPGGLSPSGGLMLDSDAVDKYFRSFMDNMHILHPFLEPKVLRNMIHAFKRKYSWDYRATQQVAAIGTKRKREMTESPASTPKDDHNRTQPRAFNHPVPPIEHSVANGIVLLVLALGKVCAHREPLPGPASTASMRTSTPHSAMYSDLPMTASAPTSPYNNQVNMNGTVSSPANPQGKNMDLIPGLAYFAKAADIIGELPGGADVSHIQAYLLAGLYMGQLARILPSYFYINKACIAAQILIESTPYLMNTMKPSRRNLVNFAFWSCLQLESDIAAELELPLSGIGRYESPQHKEFPTNITLERIPESSVDDDILRFYSYQIQLRTTINSVHATLYRESKSYLTRPSDSITSALDDNLENWRKMLNEWDWDDDDHESPNINIARMRGKYYGAKYIIWRPMLRWSLQLATGPPPKPKRPSESPAGHGAGSEVTSPSVSNLGAPHLLGGKDVPYIAPELLYGCKKCVEAAIRSTTSFDAVPRRLVVTNIFGTTHAQFGNMLVLYATFTSPHPGLNSLISEETLKRLHDRTVRILKENEAISPVLAKNLKILEYVKRQVFPATNYPTGSTASSFESGR